MPVVVWGGFGSSRDCFFLDSSLRCLSPANSSLSVGMSGSLSLSRSVIGNSLGRIDTLTTRHSVCLPKGIPPSQSKGVHLHQAGVSNDEQRSARQSEISRQQS